MSTVYSVSEIVSIFDGAIQSKPTLRNVRVQGEVQMNDGAPSSFFLKGGPEEEKLRCFILAPDNIAFGDAPIQQGNPVVVKGKITFFYAFSQYQVKVKVSDIQAPGVNRNRSNVTDVAGITKLISDLVTGTQELQNIQIRGRIFSRAYGLVLRDDNGYELKVSIPDTINAPVGGKVCVRGKVSIDSSESRYQIEVTDIVPGIPACQCSGCDYCTRAGCNEAREPKYELCPECYKVSRDHEEKVEEKVKKYFSNLKVKGFSPKTQHGIQMGADNRKADVVLVKVKDGNEIFAAIAECKGAGFVGEGKKQLNSYLSATDTRFGVFANRADEKHWKFYENLRRNQFVPIPRKQFEDGVVKGIILRKQLKKQIKTLEAKIGGLRTEVSDLERQKGKLMDEIQHSETLFADLKNDLSAKIGDLRTEIGDLERQKGKLTEEIRHSETFFADLNNEVGDLEHRTRELMEEIRHSETFFADLKKDLSEQFKTFLADLKRDKKQSLMNKLKTLFSKKNE